MTEKINGQYTYGDPYPDNIKGTSVPFTIEWTLIDGIIKGTCEDDEGKKVFDEPARLYGFIDNGIISFIKKYPKYWEIDENGFTTVFDQIPPPEIHYSGIVVENHFEGEWEMSVTYELQNGVIDHVTSKGTWTMHRST